MSCGMNKYGPTRGEHLFRLIFSLFGLGCIGALFVVHGIPSGPGLVEVVGIAGAFFGGTLILSARALLRRDQG
jgi:hypothetical protein